MFFAVRQGASYVQLLAFEAASWYTALRGFLDAGEVLKPHSLPLVQVGSFVPAEYVSPLAIDRLFTRASTADDMEANVSAFTAEMGEKAFVLQNINPRSMVIIDELGRSPSTTDGQAVAEAVAE
ncbi:muts domain V-domain-containing protein [Aspergillus similis]